MIPVGDEELCFKVRDEELVDETHGNLRGDLERAEVIDAAGHGKTRDGKSASF